jgi:hypothetical protein
MPAREIAGTAFVTSALAMAAVLWTTSLPRFDLRSMNDLGLISVAPPQALAALALIALAFVLSLRLGAAMPVLAALAVVLVVATVHALPSFVEDAPRQSVAYLHAGFTDEIERTGHLLTNADARFSWPVFFSLGALVTSVAGIGNAIDLQTWAAPALNLAYLVPLYVIYRALTTDRRLVWAALFLFVATNWVGQDYYSPQGFNYLLYLTVLAILLRWFRRREVIRPVRWIVEFTERRWPGIRHGGRADEAPVVDEQTSPSQRLALGLIVVLLIGVSVASHQLTPFAILAAVTALTVLRRTSLVGLPALVAVLLGMWISYMTVAFLQGHLASLVADVGSVGGTATQNVTQRLAGSPGHLIVVQVRLIATAGLWLLAAAGAIRRFRHGHLDIEAVALAAVPFGLIGFQAYGGEMLLRVYLFSLPFMTFLVAGLFLPAAGRPFSRTSTSTFIATAAGLAVLLMLTKHGNELADWISADELAATDYLYATAPVGSTLATVNRASPLKYRQFEQYHYVDLFYLYEFDEPEAVEDFLAGYDTCAYIFVSRTQHVNSEMYGGVPPGYWDAARVRFKRSHLFSVVYENRDATIFELRSARSHCHPAASR